jgi:adenylate cyclase class 2
VDSDPSDSGQSASCQEVEVKYRVRDLQRLLTALARLGVTLSDPVLQDDQAYAPLSWEYGQPKAGVPFARLRTEEGRHLFTVKRPIDNELACVEHESLVADRNQMHGAVQAMGFRPTVRIVKTRRSGMLGGVTLCVDEVESAGVYLELERLIGMGESGAAVQRDLDQFALSLGVALERTTATYDSLIRDGASSRLEEHSGAGQPGRVDR